MPRRTTNGTGMCSCVAPRHSGSTRNRPVVFGTAFTTRSLASRGRTQSLVSGRGARRRTRTRQRSGSFRPFPQPRSLRAGREHEPGAARAVSATSASPREPAVPSLALRRLLRRYRIPHCRAVTLRRVADDEPQDAAGKHDFPIVVVALLRVHVGDGPREQ